MSVKSASRIFIWSLTFSTLWLASCGDKHEQKSEPLAPTQLVAQDLVALKSVNRYGLESYDRTTNGIFSKVFGGTTPEALERFWSARMKYVFSKDQVKQMKMLPFEPQDTDAPFMSESANAPKSNRTDEEQEDMTVAQNLSTAIFVVGLGMGQSFTLDTGREQIPIRSLRPGIMVIGNGYTPSVSVSGRTVVLPAAYRQATLLHEARHSDCTGGYTKEDVQKLKNAKDIVETLNVFPLRCSHLHDFCPAGHEYAGMMACDRHPWGSYTISYLYGSAMMNSHYGVDRAILESMAIDKRSRFLFNANDMLAGKLGQPDMSHSEERP